MSDQTSSGGGFPTWAKVLLALVAICAAAVLAYRAGFWVGSN